MIERPEAFNFFGLQSLFGPELKPGDAAPDFSLLNAKLKPVTMAAFAGKPLVISVVPSLDTGVCNKQTLRFNEAAATLGDKVNFITVSADLPFAQARWCSSAGADTIQTLSDHQAMSFAQSYGTYLQAFRLESRAVFVVDSAGVIQYVEYVPAAGTEPNYDAALEALHKLVA
ncbi:thiol peroxidase [Candidatus Chloroploca sp. Khr17]|uniref:thiol peroxidase n=1 Tax=Candidatus Chloroploca sp. Khr17 TaxID=2496869 RepID=UPI00101C77C5|nr:thiol peroxidase [Candidatus Chloroploca sp. Khr17]